MKTAMIKFQRRYGEGYLLVTALLKLWFALGMPPPSGVCACAEAKVDVRSLKEKGNVNERPDQRSQAGERQD